MALLLQVGAMSISTTLSQLTRSRLARPAAGVNLNNQWRRALAENQKQGLYCTGPGVTAAVAGHTRLATDVIAACSSGSGFPLVQIANNHWYRKL